MLINVDLLGKKTWQLPFIIGRSASGGVGWNARLAGESFLDGLVAGKLRRVCRAEEDHRNRQKLQVAYHYESGKTVTGAACTGRETACEWLADIRKRGSATIPHHKSTAAPEAYERPVRPLVLDMQKGPRKCGYKANAWPFALHGHAMRKFGAEIAYRTFVDNMHELNLVTRPPGRLPPRRGIPRGAHRVQAGCARAGTVVRGTGMPPALP